LTICFEELALSPRQAAEMLPKGGKLDTWPVGAEIRRSIEMRSKGKTPHAGDCRPMRRFTAGATHALQWLVTKSGCVLDLKRTDSHE
jgi:hypothetical protein